MHKPKAHVTNVKLAADLMMKGLYLQEKGEYEESKTSMKEAISKIKNSIVLAEFPTEKEKIFNYVSIPNLMIQVQSI